ncbi:hypothetical protein ILUMI_11291 [Ignelater luminosus]|uniref:HTH psq-type domain-containing protein n=1 Tax=Ignelater luminosus TaxID=2038154 RepID=A0A8K0D0R7_IGNLU|nr:hypothetical protein ILUMI_11291 [Ignelater luminosus]
MKPGSGRKIGFQDTNLAIRIRQFYRRNLNLSEHTVANKFGTSKATLHRVKVKAGLKTYKIQKVPDGDQEKERRAKCRARKLYNDFFTKFDCCVMDDETYCAADISQILDQEYSKKFLIWQAICTCVLKSDSVLLLDPLMAIFMLKNPDLATCHYGKLAQEFYPSSNISIVSKDSNPLTWLELRPVERYWALKKRKLKNTKSQSANINDFCQKWRKSRRKSDQR